MITTIILTIYCIIFCMMLFVKNDISILAEYADTEGIFNIDIPYVTNTEGGTKECTRSKVTKSLHLTCQFTRAGTQHKHSILMPDI
jgi:hypothetical protein